MTVHAKFHVAMMGSKTNLCEKKTVQHYFEENNRMFTVDLVKYSHGDTAVWTVSLSVLLLARTSMHSQRCLCSDVLPCHKSLFIWTFSGVSAFLVKLTLKVLNF